MWNEPTREELNKLPSLDATGNLSWEDTVIYEHFFLGACDWYMAGYSPEQRIFFGYAILNDDLDNSEWGYIGFDELREVMVRGVEVCRDLRWRARTASEVERIVHAYRQRGGR